MEDVKTHNLTQLVLLRYLGKQETRKLRLFTQMLHAFYHKIHEIHFKLEMWANAQRDGRPAEYKRRPLFDAAKFGLANAATECRAVTLPGRETRWNLQGCPKLANRSQPLGGQSSPYCEDVWGRYCCLTSGFPVVDTCLSCEDIAW